LWVKMLSELTPTQTQTVRFVRDGIGLKGMIQPGPKIPMGKRFIRSKATKFESDQLNLDRSWRKAQDQDRNQCCPNLNLDGIGAGPDKVLILRFCFRCLKKISISQRSL